MTIIAFVVALLVGVVLAAVLIVIAVKLALHLLPRAAREARDVADKVEAEIDKADA